MDFVNTFSNLPPSLATILIAMLPLAELRGAIPIALTVYQLPVVTAYLLAVFGNMVPAVMIVWLLGPLSGFLMERFNLARKFFEWLFSRTRHKFSGKYEKWGELALVVFVAIPFPATGAWTGAAAAFLFGIPKNRSVGLIGLGVLISGVVVSLATLGLVKLF